MSPDEIRVAIRIAQRILDDEDWKYDGGDVLQIAAALVYTDPDRIAELERTRDAIQADANRALEKHRENTFALQNEILAHRRELQRWRTDAQIEGDYVDQSD